MGPRGCSDSFAHREWRDWGGHSAVDRLTIFRLPRLTAEEDGTKMNKRNLLTIGGAAALGLVLIALPASSARPQTPDASTIARLQQRIDELEAKLQAQLESGQNQVAELADADALEESGQTVMMERQEPTQIEVLPGMETDDRNIVFGDDDIPIIRFHTRQDFDLRGLLPLHHDSLPRLLERVRVSEFCDLILPALELRL